MRIDDITRQSLLYDFYGALLSERQNEVMKLYHEENLSLAEIAGELEISRQGVHDALKKAEKSLLGYEEKLGLVEKFSSTSKAIEQIDERIEKLIQQLDKDETGRSDFASELMGIRKVIDRLEE